MDGDYEADFELGDKRSKGIKNRRSKEFKRFAKSGTVQKGIVPQSPKLAIGLIARFPFFVLFY